MNDTDRIYTITRPEITVTILDTKDCNCFIPGEKISFQFPEIVKRKSDRLCLRFLHALLPVLEDIIAGKKPKVSKQIDDTTFVLKCTRGSCQIAVAIDIETTSSDTKKIAPKGTENLHKELSELKMFDNVDPDAVFKLANCCELMQLEEGQKIVSSGETGKNLFLVLSGFAEVQGEEKDGVTHTLALLKKGDSIGEMSILTREPISATVVAHDKCRLAKVSRLEFIGILTRYPSLNLYYSKLLADRLRNSNKQFISQFEQGVAGKLSTVSLPDLTQIIKLNAQSGKLIMSFRSKKGTLFFNKGVLFNAEYRKLKGEEAFYELIQWKTGSFVFEDCEISGSRVIKTDLMGLILEAMRRQDENDR